MRDVLLLHSGATVDLKLVKLYKVQAEAIYLAYALDNLVVALVGETQDKVPANIQTSCLALGNGIYGALEIVTTVYVGKCGVVDRLDAILNGDIFIVG